MMNLRTVFQNKALRRFEQSTLAAFLVTALLSLTAFGAACGEVRKDVLRMHVIANSDSEADQALKLQVRDAVLAAGGTLFDGTLTVEQAESLVENDLAALQAAADRVLQANGADYGAKVEVARDFFPTRTYADDVTLPAGVYTAVRVTLGSGAGQNWWCVMFPPLCLPAAEGETALSDVLSSAETDVVEKSPRLEPRFKLVELFEKIAEKFR